MHDRTRIDLGCGNDKRSNSVGVDVVETEAVDKVQDLDEPEWDLPENHFRDVKAENVFEHLENPVQFIENVWKICRDGARVEIIGPHISSQNWHDPTHKRLLGSRTFDNFSENPDFDFYSDARFRIKQKHITFQKRKILFYNYLIEKLVNFNGFTTWYYENSFLSRIFPAQNIRFVLEVEKNAN